MPFFAGRNPPAPRQLTTCWLLQVHSGHVPCCRCILPVSESVSLSLSWICSVRLVCPACASVPVSTDPCVASTLYKCVTVHCCECLSSLQMSIWINAFISAVVYIMFTQQLATFVSLTARLNMVSSMPNFILWSVFAVQRKLFVWSWLKCQDFDLTENSIFNPELLKTKKSWHANNDSTNK